MKNSMTKQTAHNTATRFYKFDSTLGFWGVPSVKGDVLFETCPDEYIQVPVQHNEDGNRDAPVPSKSKNNTIICLGGSHTWGAGVAQEVRYTEQLQKRVGCRVVNMGHCSLGLDQVCLAILQRSAKYNPKVIVVEQHPWSIHRVLNHYVNGYVRPYFCLDRNQKLRLQKVPYLAKYETFRSIFGSYLGFKKEFLEYRGGVSLKTGYAPETDPIFLYWKTKYYDGMYNLVGKIMCVMRDQCRQRGVNLIFALGAIKQQLGLETKSELIDYDLPRNRLIELLKKNGIAYVDMLPAMKATHSENDPVVFADGHINAKGHDVFARELFNGLQARSCYEK
jgi:hypothetical protein